MKRKKAIEMLAKRNLPELTLSERHGLLAQVAHQQWVDFPEWDLLPDEVRNELSGGAFRGDAAAGKFDEILLIMLKWNLRGVTNAYLCAELDLDSLEGEPEVLKTCGCCGRRTLDENATYEYSACKICFWSGEDDNRFADHVPYSTGKGISLTQARYHFIKYGIYDPTQTLLLKYRAELGKYELDRVFRLTEDGYVVEEGTDWKGKPDPDWKEKP